MNRMEQVHACGCGKTFTKAEYLALLAPRAGDKQMVPADDDQCNCTNFVGAVMLGPGQHFKNCPGRPYTLTVRNCPCGSTMYEELTP